MRINSYVSRLLVRYREHASDTRRAYMLRNKLPGPYDDTVGPTVLGILLMMSIVSQFLIKLNSILS